VNRIAWRRAAEGLQLAGIGVFLLLTTQGVIPWSFWVEAASFWPVLLVGFGLGLIFERSRAPWAVLLSPLVVLGTLGWVARGGHAAGFPGQEWVSRSVARPEGAERCSFVAHLAGARIDLTSAVLGEGLLAEGRSASRDGSGRLDLRRSGSIPVVRLDEGQQTLLVFGPRRRQVWDLRLDETLPVGLDLQGAFLGGRLDLTRGRLTEAEVQGMGNAFEARLPRPRTDVTLRLQGIFNELRLVVPASTPVRVHAEGPFNSVDRGGTSASDGRPGYDVRVDGIMNRVVVEESEKSSDVE
jgi:hypothetical protein